MRIAVCNRKVVEGNGRPVYHIDKPKEVSQVRNTVAAYDIVLPSKVYKANPCSMYLLTLVVGFGYLQTGFAIMATNTIDQALKAKFEWSSDKAVSMNLMINAAAIFGLITGTLLGNCFIKQGRRRALMIFNMLALIATSLTMVVNEPLMVVGRLLFGLCCGVFIYAGQKFIEETAPVNMITYTATSSKSFLFGGILICLLLGLGLPRTEDELKDSEYWRVIYGFQYVCQVMTVILFAACFPEDSISFNIEQGKDTEALTMIKKVYASSENP